MDEAEKTEEINGEQTNNNIENKSSEDTEDKPSENL
jgi:hypothetical protein